MARSPSLPLYDCDDLSSPDPLAKSHDDENLPFRCTSRSTSPVKRMSLYTSKRYPIDSGRDNQTPQTANRSRPLMESPRKTVTEQTISPWKIRVTVETEPEDMGAEGATTNTGIMKIPLRDTSSPTEHTNQGKKGNRMQATPAKSKRSGTPVRKNGSTKSRSRRQSVTDLDITVLGDVEDSDDWVKRRSPTRKRPSRSRKLRQISSQIADADAKEPSPVKSKRKGKPSPQIIDIREDTDVEHAMIPDGVPEIEGDSPGLRSIDLNRVSVRPRSMSSKRRPNGVMVEAEDAQEPHKKAGKAISNDPRQSCGKSVSSYPTPEPSTQDEMEVNELPTDPTDKHQGFDTILESEGFTMIDLESIPSARNFLSSPSANQNQEATLPANTETLAEHTGQRATGTLSHPQPKAIPQGHSPVRSRPTPIPSYLTLQEGESDISSNVPSSPPIPSNPQLSPHNPEVVGRSSRLTPELYSSPSLPPPPKPLLPASVHPSVQGRKSTPPKLVRVVRAGIALQGVLSPRVRSDQAVAASPQIRTPKERLDDLFGGFDSSTRRELRAGLRFGEELAKRQRNTSKAKSDSNQSRVEKEMLTQASPAQMKPGTSLLPQSLPSSQVLLSKAPLQHPPLHVTNEQTGMLEKCSLSRRLPLSEDEKGQKFLLSGEISHMSSTPEKATGPLGAPSLLGHQALAEKTSELERESLPQKIKHTSKSQAVVVESDSEGRDHFHYTAGEATPNEKDIWCIEAASSNPNIGRKPRRSRPAEGRSHGDFPTEEQRKRSEQGREVLTRPRRSLIPSPWKRGVNVADGSTFLTNGDMTGLFDHAPTSKIKFGTAEIERQKRQLSSSFDADPLTDKSQDAQQELELKDTAVTDSNVASDEEDYLDSDQDKPGLPQDDPLHEQSMSEDEAFSEMQGRRRTSSPQNSGDEGAGFKHLESPSDLDQEESPRYSSPQTIKIPVNFNDSSISNIAPPLTRSSPSTEQDSSRPCTPRSAMKGGRASFGIERTDISPVRRVVFSKCQVLVDEDGKHQEETLKSLSPSPGPGVSADVEVMPIQQSPINPDKRKTWFGWPWSKIKGSSSNSTTPTPATDGASEGDGIVWQNTKSSIPHTIGAAITELSQDTTQDCKTPSYLLPPSYPSDPGRDISISLSTAGEFTNTHFRTMHVIYAKSLRPRFHGPKLKEVRPGLKKLIGTKFAVDESASGLGLFEWEVDENAVRVVERFMQEVEWGHPDSKKVEWGWSEKKICERLLCRIVIGQEVRKEEAQVLSAST